MYLGYLSAKRFCYLIDYCSAGRAPLDLSCYSSLEWVNLSGNEKCWILSENRSGQCWESIYYW